MSGLTGPLGYKMGSDTKEGDKKRNKGKKKYPSFPKLSYKTMLLFFMQASMVYVFGTHVWLCFLLHRHISILLQLHGI